MDDYQEELLDTHAYEPEAVDTTDDATEL